MKSYQPADIRNFAIVGHATSGKTMLAEAMLMWRRNHPPHGQHRPGFDGVRLPCGRAAAADSIHATPLSLECRIAG